MGGSPAIHLHVNNAFEKAPATIQKLDQLANNQSNRLLSLPTTTVHCCTLLGQMVRLEEGNMAEI